MMASFTATSTTPPSTTPRRIGWRCSARSRLMPTEIRNTPSSRPLNGSMVTSIWRRNSVSASSSPAISEPSSIGRPTTAVARPVARITSRHAATNSSGLPVRATLRNSGRSTRRPATISADHDEHRLDDGRGERCRLGAEYADDEQHRHRGDVLQQQDGQRGAADRSAETLLVRQHLHDDGGGRHRQRRPDDDGEQRRRAECEGDRRDRHRAQHELQQPEAEHQPAHHAQPLQRQLQADHEHHHADAEFGDRRDRSRAGSA